MAVDAVALDQYVSSLYKGVFIAKRVAQEVDQFARHRFKSNIWVHMIKMFDYIYHRDTSKLFTNLITKAYECSSVTKPAFYELAFDTRQQCIDHPTQITKAGKICRIVSFSSSLPEDIVTWKEGKISSSSEMNSVERRMVIDAYGVMNKHLKDVEDRINEVYKYVDIRDKSSLQKIKRKIDPIMTFLQTSQILTHAAASVYRV